MQRRVRESSFPLARLAPRAAALLAAFTLILLTWPGAGAGAADETSDPRRTTVPPPADGLRANVPQTYALTGADVVVRPGEMLEGATIVVREGKIAAVGRDVEIPADAQRIDASGKRIYPGFIDAYAELPSERSDMDPALSETHAAKYWNTNVTPQISAARILAIDERAHDSARQSGIVARLYAPSAGVIKGTAALVSTAEGAGGDTAILADDVAMVAQLIPQGRGGLGRGGGGASNRTAYPRSPMGAFALVRQALYDAQWYQQARQAVSENAALPLPERNDALAALRPVLEGETPVMFINRDELYALRSEKVAEEFELEAIHVGSGYEYRRMDLVSGTERPIVLPLDFPRPPDVSTPEQAEAADLEDLLHWDLAPSNPQKVHEAGMKMAFSAQGLRRVEQEFLGNVRRSVTRGLPADAALAALTVDAAEILGVESLLGTIEPGKLASFVVADGDLFAQRGRARVLETWVDGQRHRIVRDPVTDFRGTWEIEVPDADKVRIRIGGTPERPNGRVVTPGGDRTTRPERDEDDGDEGAADPDEGDGADEPDLSLTSGAAQPRQRPGGQDREQGEGGRPQAQVDQPSSGGGRGGPGSLRNVRMSGDRFTFTTDGRPFGKRGVVVVSLTRIGETASGIALMPDGTRVPITATLIEAADGPTTRPGRDGEVDAEMPTRDDEPVEAAEGQPTEVQGGTTRTSPPEREGPGSEMETTATGPSRDSKPLFEPNYPLGAFGRETPQAPEQQTVVFRNGTIWTAGPAGIIENGYVVISDGKIVAVGEGEPEDVPEGATTVDLDGRHVSPGMIDAHSHIASDSGINEGTQAVTAEVRLQDYVNPDDINIYRQLAGGTTMANVLHGSANPIGGQNVVIKFRWGQGPDEMIMAEAPKGVKFALGENVKRSSSRYPNSRMGVPEVIADAFRAAQDYQRARAQYKEYGGLPVRTDLELEAMSEMLTGERLIHCHSYRQDEILATLRVLEEFDIQIGSLQHILEGYKVAAEMANHAKDIDGNDGLGATASTFSDW